MNLFVQMLTNRAQRVLKNTEGESNRTFGLGISPTFKDRVVGSPSSSNLDGTGEADCCLVVFGMALTSESMGALGESSGQSDSSHFAAEKVDIDPFPSADQMVGGAGS